MSNRLVGNLTEQRRIEQALRGSANHEATLNQLPTRPNYFGDDFVCGDHCSILTMLSEIADYERITEIVNSVCS